MRRALVLATLPILAALACRGPQPQPGTPRDTAVAGPTDSGTTDTAPTPHPGSSSSSWIDVAAGLAVTCGIRTSGEIECWGLDRYLDRPPPSGTDFVEVEIGGVFACALRADGSVECWGCGSEFSGAPVCQARPGPYTRLEVGSYAACAQRPDGGWDCWGDGPNSDDAPSPPSWAPFVEVELGHFHTCAIATGTSEPECWGKAPYPDTLPPDGTYVSKAAMGYLHGCGLTYGGAAVCWGLDHTLQPYVEPPIGSFVDIGSLDQLTCALSADGQASCWGPAHIVDPAYFLPPPGDVAFVRLSVGNTHACGLNVGGEIVCWGTARGLGETTVPE